MKIIKLIKLILLKLILLKLIIRLDKALIEAKPNQDERNEANKAIFNADRRADRATKADTRRGERKAKQKAKQKAKKGKIRQAKYGNKNKSDNKDDNKRRGENNFRLWEITKSYNEGEREVQPDHQPHPYSLFHSY